MTKETQVAVAIREELKKNYPLEKFRVRSNSYAGGSSVTVYYPEGADSAGIREMTSKYEHKRFDEMDESAVIRKSKGLPQVTYILVQRDY